MCLAISPESNIVAYVVVVMRAQKIIRASCDNNYAMSAMTRLSNLVLICALLLRAKFPFICVFPVFINLFATLAVGKNAFIQEYFGFASTLWISVLDPIVTIWFVRP